MSFSPESEKRLFTQRIELLRRQEHIPGQILDIVTAVYERQIEARETANIVIPPKDDLAAADMHAQGAPLLDRDQFPYDEVQARELFVEFATLLQQQGGPAADAATDILAAVEKQALDLPSVFFSYVKGDDTMFASWAEKTPEAPRTLAFLTQSSMLPSLAAAADALAENLDPERVWTHNHCPTCGSLPLMSELREKEGYRYASCSFCQTSYRIPRMACAYCAETDHEKLSYFTADDETGYRVDVCESCKLYLKAVDFREMDKKPLPIIDDLESLALDILAGNEGYKRPTLSGLGF